VIEDSIRGKETIDGKIQHPLNLSGCIPPDLIVDKVHYTTLLGKKSLKVVQ
jgi:hypothetical protein